MLWDPIGPMKETSFVLAEHRTGISVFSGGRNNTLLTFCILTSKVSMAKV